MFAHALHPIRTGIMEEPEKRIRRAIEEEVAIEPYDPNWPQLFEEEKRHLQTCLPPGLIGRIEHFGSTAVPGLAAKAIIDILVEVSSLDATEQIITPILQAQGYDYFWRPSWYDANVPAYIWFIKRDATGRRTHHVHMLESDSPDWERLLFRDYLIENPEVAREYEALKYRIAREHPNDRIAYAKGKTKFITQATRAARKHYRSR
jgi:GrpB-like predicted nucleotidyltransferase (UPF0157 family)